MLVEPQELLAGTVLGIVRQHWDAGAVSCAYVPCGAGAYHWVASGRHQPRWFVTADDVSAPGRLEELLDTYAAAQELAERGHHVVVPAVSPQASGHGVGVVLGAYLVTVTTYLEGAFTTVANDHARAAGLPLRLPEAERALAADERWHRAVAFVRAL